MIVRYFVIFPIFVPIVIHREAWIEASITHLFATFLLFAGAHILLKEVQARFVAQSTLDMPPNDAAEEFPQSLGLRDS